MKLWIWLVIGLTMISLLVIANSRGPNSVVTIIVPDNFRGVIRVPIKNSQRFWESKTITCIVSERGEATEIIGPTFSLRRAQSTSGREIPIVFGRPQLDEYGLYSSDVGGDDYLYLIAGGIADYEAGFDEIKDREMQSR
ncbi:MAG: hypothetical protein WD716_01190 [Fimbriimonadaceae bacterium]